MVLAQALFMVLRWRYPQTELDVLGPPWSLPVLQRMPEVARGIELDVGHGELGWAARRRLGHSLRGRYDQAIVLPRSLKSALVPWFARVPVRTGYRGEWRYGLVNDRRPLDKNLLPQTVQRFVALGLAAGAPLPPEVPAPRLSVDAARRLALFEQHGLAPDQPPVALMPGAAFGPTKRWPVMHYAQLARRLGEAGRATVVFGSPGERELGEAIAQVVGPSAHNLCGRAGLVDTIDMLGGCAAAVSNDSGQMHMAAAVGIPVVAVYGGTTPEFAPPLSPHAKSLWLGLACSPCFKRSCPLGHSQCLTRIAVADALAALAGLGVAVGN